MEILLGNECRLHLSTLDARIQIGLDSNGKSTIPGNGHSDRAGGPE